MPRYPTTATMGGLFEDVLDVLTGGPQKRARIARDEKRAAEAARDAAIAQARSAVEVARYEAEARQELLKTGLVGAVVVVGALLLLSGSRSRSRSRRRP